MANITDLTGATITVPSGWTATEGYGQFYLDGNAYYKFSSNDDFSKSSLRSDLPSLCIGYGVYDTLFAVSNVIYCRIVLDNGSNSSFTGSNTSQFFFKFEISGGQDATNPKLIQWFLDNNATIVYEKEQKPTIITYNETTTTITEGQTATIKCEEVRMKTDIVVSGKCKITYNNVETNIEEGQVATVKCKEYKMYSDVLVEVAKAITAYKASVTGLGNSSPTSQVYTRDDNFPTSFEEVTDEFGNIFVKIPTMYRKVDSVVDSQITAFTMSTAKVDDTYVPYSVFVKPNGEVMPYVLIGKYLNNSTTSMNSITLSTTNTNVYISNARTYAQALGNGYQQYDWQFQKLFVDLALLISQKVNFNDGAGVDNYLGVYQLNKSVWIDGAIKNDEKWYICNDPTKYVNSATNNTDGYVTVEYPSPTSSGKIKIIGYDKNNPFFNYTKFITDTTTDTYYCDTFYHTVGNSGNIPFYSNIGNASNIYGLWHFRASSGWSDRYNARLCYRPLDEII